MPQLSRRQFLLTGAALASVPAAARTGSKPVVSIVRIQNGKIAMAVEKAIDLLGGIKRVTKGVHSVMLKPNLVSTQAEATTKLAVVRAVAETMLRAGKQVSIGEGSAAAPKFNVLGTGIYRTRKREILDPMQQYVFDQLGYTDLAKTLRVALVNLHSGDLVDVDVPGGFVFDKITLHRSLAEVDMLCSVPMMKTHQLATVTLGMKNLIGTFPGTVYQSVRGHMHDLASRVEPTAASAVVVDLVRANKLGLVVIDGSMAMEGDGPSMGKVFPMDVIVAGTNPVAADMVAASVMGFETAEIPTFRWANKAGLRPAALEEIEVRGEPIDRVRRPFRKPNLVSWNAIRPYWGNKELTRATFETLATDLRPPYGRSHELGIL
ncbi:MAG TPA: DUF362 domain-containing protein [Bryobacteraceae bacterium]|jgi:uncharacterized protein (DUF362 family)|nr:DUF362 domain-containing protein [Bryobacteraceae bacterium]